MLLQYYRDDKDGYDIGAEHDQLYAYATSRPLSAEAVRRMIELGWWQERADCSTDFSEEMYDSENGWTCYV